MTREGTVNLNLNSELNWPSALQIDLSHHLTVLPLQSRFMSSADHPTHLQLLDHILERVPRPMSMRDQVLAITDKKHKESTETTTVKAKNNSLICKRDPRPGRRAFVYAIGARSIQDMLSWIRHFLNRGHGPRVLQNYHHIIRSLGSDPNKYIWFVCSGWW